MTDQMETILTRISANAVLTESNIQELMYKRKSNLR